MLTGIKSKYILEEILSYITKKVKLKLVTYNKKLQSKFNISKNDYKYFGKIVIELFPCELNEDEEYKYININSKDESFYHIYFNDDEKEIGTAGITNFFKYLFKEKYCIKKSDEIKKIKVIIDKKVTSLKGLFKECQCLEKINFIIFENDHITDMSEMFEECINLCSLDILKINTEQVTDMKEMFRNCKKLEK